MATVAEQLIISYARAKAQKPSLRKGQFMQQAFSGRYKNEESAYQAYNQTVKGRRTGGRIGKLATEAQPPIRHPEKIKGPRRPRPAGNQFGIWKVNITFTYIDERGEEYEQTRSFIAQSDTYVSLLDIPYIEEIIVASVDEHIEYWIENDSLGGNYTNVQVEVVPIYRTDKSLEKGEVVDLDEIDELVIE